MQSKGALSTVFLSATLVAAACSTSFRPPTTLTPGDITLTASRAGLTSGTATVTSKAVTVVNGLL